MSNSQPTSARGRFHVSELARQAGVTSATVRYYARVGLLSPDREAGNGYRSFSAEDLHRVVFIRQAQALGLTIADVMTIFASLSQGGMPRHQVERLVERRLRSIRRRIADLHRTEAHMTRALANWQNMKDPSPRDGEYCPLIERLGPLGAAPRAGKRPLQEPIT